jgi:histidyl-tRNA synthetase
MGVERVVELTRLAGQLPAEPVPDLFVMAQGATAQRTALQLAEQLRDAFPGRSIVVHGNGQVQDTVPPRRRTGARRLIIGDDELARGVVALKALRGAESTQVEYPVAELAARVDEFFRRST